MDGQYDYPGRISRARLLMEEHGVDCMLLSVGSDLTYFTGYRAMPLERLTMLVLPRKPRREPVLVVPALEAPRVEPGPFRVRPWGETEDPVAISASIAGRPAVAAIGDQTWAVFLLDLFAHMTETTFVPASLLTRELRVSKDPAEMTALRRAAAAVDRVLGRIPNQIRFEGSTERQVARGIRDLILEEGHEEALFCIVASGPNAASPHHEPSDRVIEKGDLVVIDFGGRLDGYCSDVTRTFVVGEPDPLAAEIHRVVADAQEAAKEAAKPGVSASRVDRAARRVIADAGYGEFFTHRVGHGIGLDVHEHPYLVEGNDQLLEPGMVFSIEPGVYLPGRFGVRIEDICVVTDSGVESLNSADRGLTSVE